VVEIETEISARDFQDLFDQCKERLDKHRYLYSYWHNGQELIWEIDLFYTNQNGYSKLYFILAEHEMPEGQHEPVVIPPLVAEYLVYAVPREETGDYSSRKLSDPHYASGRYTLLTQKEIGYHVSAVS
jgi:CYTH domain-containing protein